MSTFTYTPDFGAEKTKKPEVKVIKFGDGYEQRTTFGMNTSPGQWALKWENINDTDSAAIEAFFEARNGTQSFAWTPPTGSSINAVCEEWKVAKVKNNLNMITATFREVFEP